MARGKGGLGRGLDSLFEDAAPVFESGAKVDTLPLREIEPDPEQPRKTFDEQALGELAASIAEHGLLQPIAVRPRPRGGYSIVAGERRWRAARMAGLDEVPVLIKEVTDEQAAALALIENLQREDLDPIEVAEGCKKLIERYGLTQEEAAERLGKSRSAITNAMRLLKLCPPVRAMVEDGRLSSGHARAILPLSPAMQESAANAIIKDELSVRQTEQLVKKLTAPPKPEQPEPDGLSVDYAKEAAKELGSRLGRGCRIVTGRKKGRIELEYYGVEDLNQLLDALHALKTK